MRRRGLPIMLIIGAIYALYHVISYYGTTQVNEFTGEEQRISLSIDQEIQMGLNSAPQMAAQHGGLYQNEQAQVFVDRIGHKLLDTEVLRNTPFNFDFHLLADAQTVNAFALPGGQVFITFALFSALDADEDRVAGVLGHEIGHVLARHSSERIAKSQLGKGLTDALVIATGDQGTSQIAHQVNTVIQMSHGRDQELESDDLGVRLMMQAGYDPMEMIEVMKVLKAASGGSQRPEWQSSHPNPENRAEKILESIQKYSGQGRLPS